MTITINGKEVLHAHPAVTVVALAAVVAWHLADWAWTVVKARQQKRHDAAISEFRRLMQFMPKFAPTIQERTEEAARFDRDRGMV